MAAQVAKNPEQIADLVRSDGRGRFVHQEDARLQRKRLRDLDQLHLRHAQVHHRRRRRRVEPNHLDPRPGQAVDRGVIDQLHAARRDALQEDVLRDRELGDEVALLVYDADPGGEGRTG